jgi:hypothetical protein
MATTIRKIRLGDEKFQLITDPQEALDVFAAILHTGQALYPRSRRGKRWPVRMVRLEDQWIPVPDGTFENSSAFQRRV